MSSINTSDDAYINSSYITTRSISGERFNTGSNYGNNGHLSTSATTALLGALSSPISSSKFTKYEEDYEYESLKRELAELRRKNAELLSENEQLKTINVELEERVSLGGFHENCDCGDCNGDYSAEDIEEEYEVEERIVTRQVDTELENKYNELRTELVRLRGKNEELNREVERLKSLSFEFESKISSKNNEVSNLKREVERSETRVKQLEAEIRELQLRLSKATDNTEYLTRIKQLEFEISNKTNESSNYSRQLERSEARARQLETENRELLLKLNKASDNTEFVSRIKQLEFELSNKNSELTNMSRQFEREVQKSRQLEIDLRDLNIRLGKASDNTEYLNRIKSLEYELSSKNNEINSIARQYENTVAKSRQLEAELRDLHIKFTRASDNTEYINRIKSLEIELKNRTGQLDKYGQERDGYQRELQYSKQRYEEQLIKMRTELSAEIDRLNASIRLSGQDGERKVQEVKLELQKAHAELDSLRHKLRDYDQNISTKTTEIQRYQEQLNDHKRNSGSLQTELNLLNQQNASLLQKNEKLNIEINSLNQQISKLSLIPKEDPQKIQNLNKENERLNVLISTLMGEKNALNVRINEYGQYKEKYDQLVREKDFLIQEKNRISQDFQKFREIPPTPIPSPPSPPSPKPTKHLSRYVKSNTSNITRPIRKSLSKSRSSVCCIMPCQPVFQSLQCCYVSPCYSRSLSGSQNFHGGCGCYGGFKNSSRSLSRTRLTSPRSFSKDRISISTSRHINDHSSSSSIKSVDEKWVCLALKSLAQFFLWQNKDKRYAYEFLEPNRTDDGNTRNINGDSFLKALYKKSSYNHNEILRDFLDLSKFNQHDLEGLLEVYNKNSSSSDDLALKNELASVLNIKPYIQDLQIKREYLAYYQKEAQLILNAFENILQATQSKSNQSSSAQFLRVSF